MLRLGDIAEVDKQRMPADSRIELCFNFASTPRRIATQDKTACHVTARSFVLGARGQGYLLEHENAPNYAAIRFKPGGLAAFSRIPINDLTDTYVSLDDVWDARSSHCIVDQLAVGPTPQAQAHSLDVALLARLNPPEHLNRLLTATQQLTYAPKLPAMRALADTVNLSQKHFERLFTRYIGFRPSLFARIMRFQRALHNALAQPRALVLSQLALNAGYYDQAHFTRDFKQFSGSAPVEFLSAKHAFIQLTQPRKHVDLIQDHTYAHAV
jgi:AraC-like DNA-binding protein